jgi:type II secretory pathway component PulM
MSKRNLLNLGLLLLVGVLVLLVIYEPGIEKPQEPTRLLELEREAVTQIRIERQGQETVALTRDGGDWNLTEPLAIGASAFRIGSLLRITEQKSLGSFPAEPERLAGYGLEAPRVTLTLNDAVTVAFGDNTPLDQRRYVRLGDRVHMVSDTLYYHLIGAYTTFIRQELLPEGTALAALTLPGLRVSWQAERWQVEPRPESFSADQVTRLIDAWKLASAVQVKPYDGKQGEAITIEPGGDETPLTFLLTARTPDLVLARPELGIEYHLAESSADELLKLPTMEKATKE